MNVSQLIVLLSWISMVFCPTQAHGRDRELRFPAYYFFAERRLMKHTIKTLVVKSLEDCEYLCYLDDNCVSLNIKNKDSESGTHACELNNSTHLEHDADLVNDPVFYYRGSKNFCGKNPPCRNNAICQSGFTDKGYRCLCGPGFKGKHCEVSKNCADTYKAGERKSGVYTINPDNSGIIDVFCDQTTAGGGWLVFQKRLDGSVDFYREWAEYKSGFGLVIGEFWLGLDKIHRLTSTSKGNYKLRVDLEDFAGNTYHAEYNLFEVENEEEKYRLNLGSFTGTVEDKLTYHSGRKFSTKDQDNDPSVADCAEAVKGAWWYGDCRASNLNGVYRNGADNGTLIWGAIRPVKRAEMKIRPMDF